MSGIVSKVLKMLVYPSFLGFFLGWLIVVHLGLEGLGVFVFLVFVFLFRLAFVSVLFALFLVLWLDVVFFVCFFLFFLVFVCFCWNVRWPEGPPHLAPKPSLFYLFLFFLFFCSFCLFFCFFCLFFWRV